MIHNTFYERDFLINAICNKYPKLMNKDGVLYCYRCHSNSSRDDLICYMLSNSDELVFPSIDRCVSLKNPNSLKILDLVVQLHQEFDNL